jgi:hypothetical protein
MTGREKLNQWFLNLSDKEIIKGMLNKFERCPNECNLTETCRKNCIECWQDSLNSQQENVINEDKQEEIQIENFDFTKHLNGFKKTRIAVNCETEKDAKSFLEKLENEGFIWFNGEKLTESYNGWNDNEEQTCYSNESNELNGVVFDDLNSYKDENYKILKYRSNLC